MYFSKVLFEGLIFGGAYLRFKIDWANLIVGRKFTVFALYCLYLRAISKYKLQEGLVFGGFFALRVWGAYIWRGLYMEGLIFGILRYAV